MENLPTFIIAVIIMASIIVAYIEGEAGSIRRQENPHGFWALMYLSAGGLGALVFWSLAE